MPPHNSLETCNFPLLCIAGSNDAKIIPSCSCVNHLRLLWHLKYGLCWRENTHTHTHTHTLTHTHTHTHSMFTANTLILSYACLSVKSPLHAQKIIIFAWTWIEWPIYYSNSCYKGLHA